MPDYRKYSKTKLADELKALQTQPGNSSDVTAMQQLAHDLQVHQIELEMQNRELREAQHTIEEARDRYSSLYDFAPTGYITFSASGLILEINLTAAKMLGKERSRLVGKPFSLWLHPEDASLFSAHLRRTLKSPAYETVHDVIRIKNPEGRIIDLYLDSLYAESSHGNIPVCRSSLLDITARKQMEIALKAEHDFAETVLGTIAALVVVLDTEGRIIRFNHACEQATGYSLEEVRNRPCWDFLLLPEEIDGVKAVFAALRAGQFPNEHENHWLTKNGERRLVHWTNTAMPKPDGHIEYIIGAGIDITKQRRAEEVAHWHQNELAHIARLGMMGEMASGLAHEISQPLTAITTYAQECVRQIRAGEMNTATLQLPLEQIALQAARAREIIQHLRGFISKRQPTRTETDLNQLVQRAVALVRVETRRHGITVTLDLAPGLPAVSVDAIQIEQVILNLLRNSLEAMADAPGKQELTVRTSLTDNQEIEVAVTDTGPGLTPEAAARVFDPFYTTKEDGLGLGLAICRTLTEAHDGRLSVSPHGNLGTTFRLTLPIRGLHHER